MAYSPPAATAPASWAGATWYLPPRTVALGWWGEVAVAGPAGIPAGQTAGGGTFVTQQQFARPAGMPTEGAGHTLVTHWYEYRPQRETANAAWLGVKAYAPPVDVFLASWERELPPVAARVLLAYGVGPQAVGNPRLNKSARALHQAGWLSGAAFGQASVWNFLTYVRAVGHGSQMIGSAYAQGGVKHVSAPGISAFLSGAAGVVNTTADQSVSPLGMGLLSIGGPIVSPRIIYAIGFAGRLGVPAVQRNPSPAGFDSYAPGRPGVMFKTRRVLPGGSEGFFPGFPRVADRARKVLHHSSTVISVFGDVSLRLTSANVLVQGIGSPELSLWGSVRSTRRYVQPPGMPLLAFFGAGVKNKTPSLAALGWAFPAFGLHSIGWRVRRINASGISSPPLHAHSPSLWQTPGIRPAGLPVIAVTDPVVGHGLRTVHPVGAEMSLHGGTIVGFRYRAVLLEGMAKEASLYGLLRLEHGVRGILVSGALQGDYGAPWVSRSPRIIELQGAAPPIDRSTPMVGGRRWIFPDGFDAARFGARIVPERQTMYPLGFAGVFGLAQAFNARIYLRPTGITTYQQPSQHWGWAAVRNKRQCVSVEYVPSSGLEPMPWSQWTAIANRNRSIGTAGAATARMGAPFVFNGARALLPTGLRQPTISGALLVADRIRPICMDGLEPPHITRWAVVTNNAAVLRATGLVFTLFGKASLESNRRVLTRAGAMDVLSPGNAFIAPRVRSIGFAQRYAIAPPRLPLPAVHLSTRYIDVPPGIGPKEVGRASLQIIWRGMIPRWTHRDYFGGPRLHNATPELHGRGWVAEELGHASVRLEWRPVFVIQGSASELFGRSRIADRRQRITPVGNELFRVGDKLNVSRTGVQPPSLQTIVVANSQIPQQYFIALDEQVPKPVLNQQVLYVQQPVSSTRWGSAVVESNGIRVEPGYWDILFGNAGVFLKVRRVTVGAFSEDLVYPPSKPRLSPHTIYAVVEAPAEAQANHPVNRPPHYINEHTGANPVGEIFGRPTATLQNRRVTAFGFAFANKALPLIFNRRQKITVSGILSMRMGLPTVPGAQWVGVEQDDECTLYGAPEIAIGLPHGARTVIVDGQSCALVGQQEVALQHRQLLASGLSSMAMGGPGDANPYAWQGLRIGPLMPTIPEGFAADIYGQSWVSLRVREVQGDGYDAFVSEYDHTAFAQRMRVRNMLDGRPARRFIQQQGRACSHVSVPSLRHGTHYIRPDGNSDQHRKGAF